MKKSVSKFINEPNPKNFIAKTLKSDNFYLCLFIYLFEVIMPKNITENINKAMCDAS